MSLYVKGGEDQTPYLKWYLEGQSLYMSRVETFRSTYLIWYLEERSLYMSRVERFGPRIKYGTWRNDVYMSRVEKFRSCI